MRKKLDTRFPAARIKKIMQADEDVGKIAMAVPVLVSKALELFLQDLCDRTYDITIRRGAKTVSSLHLKHCVQSYNVFDFLKEVVSKVPDFGHSDATGDERNLPKRRKVTEDEYNDSDDELKRTKLPEISSPTISGGRGRSRGRGRGRGRARGIRTPETSEFPQQDSPKHLQLTTTIQTLDNNSINFESTDLPRQPPPAAVADDVSAGHNFDLNAGIEENNKAAAPEPPMIPVETAGMSTSAPVGAEYPDWSVSEVDGMAIDPLRHLSRLGSRLEDEDEDYDEEE